MSIRRSFEFSIASGLEGLEQRLSLSGLIRTATVGPPIKSEEKPPVVPDPEPIQPEYPTPDPEPDPGDFPGFPPPPVFPPPPIGGPIGPG